MKMSSPVKNDARTEVAESIIPHEVGSTSKCAEGYSGIFCDTQTCPRHSSVAAYLVFHLYKNSPELMAVRLFCDYQRKLPGFEVQTSRLGLDND